MYRARAQPLTCAPCFVDVSWTRRERRACAHGRPHRLSKREGRLDEEEVGAQPSLFALSARLPAPPCHRSALYARTAALQVVSGRARAPRPPRTRLAVPPPPRRPPQPLTPCRPPPSPSRPNPQTRAPPSRRASRSGASTSPPLLSPHLDAALTPSLAPLQLARCVRQVSSNPACPACRARKSGWPGAFVRQR